MEEGEVPREVSDEKTKTAGADSNIVIAKRIVRRTIILSVFYVNTKVLYFADKHLII